MKLKRLFITGLIVLMGLFLVACGSEEKGNDSTANQEQVVKYNVSFENTSLEAKKVETGTQLAQPSDPTKDKHLFTGWYLDASFNTRATFPLTIDNDTKLYAKWDSFEDAFKVARKNTVEDVNSFEFDYKIECSVGYNQAQLKGLTTGNTKYNKNSTVTFYDEHTNSGILFIDGSKYQIATGNILTKINMNEDGEIKKCVTENINIDTFKFDSSNFAKALFEWDDSKLKSIESIGNNQYRLKTGFSFSDGIKLVGNYLNHPMVKKIIGTLPSTSVETDMKVKFQNGYVSQYVYTMTINVTKITFNLTYTLDFKNINKVGTITPKQFENIAVTKSDISAMYQNVATQLSEYKNQQKFSFDFTAKTAVGFAGKNDINSTFKGSAIRKIDGSNIFFHNDIEIDSDYKNGDVYKAAGIEDIHIKKTKLSNNEVWLIEKKVLTDDKKQITDYQANNNDSYYLWTLIDMLNGDYSFGQKSVKGDKVTYYFGLSNTKVSEVMDYLETILDLDPYEKATLKVKLFGVYTDVECQDAKIEFVLEKGKLTEIELEAKGEFNTKLVDSRDFGETDLATFKINIELEITDDYTEYEPYETVKKAQ